MAKKSIKENARQILNKEITEKAFQQKIIQTAKLYGWLVYHTYDSRKCDPGFPDLACVHPLRGFFFAELKTERGRLRKEQKEWIETLRKRNIECYIWRPSDFDKVILKRLQLDLG